MILTQIFLKFKCVNPNHSFLKCTSDKSLSVHCKWLSLLFYFPKSLQFPNFISSEIIYQMTYVQILFLKLQKPNVMYSRRFRESYLVHMVPYNPFQAFDQEIVNVYVTGVFYQLQMKFTNVSLALFFSFFFLACSSFKC